MVSGSPLRRRSRVSRLQALDTDMSESETEDTAAETAVGESPRPRRLASTRGLSADERRTNRVTIVHAQSQTTFVVAGLFIASAIVMALVDNRTGWWLPLHLFLLGGVLTTISGATQLLAVPWCSSPAPHTWIVRTQQVLLAAGVILLATSHELDWNATLAAIGGVAILIALALLIGLLNTIRVTGPKDRFYPAIDGYMVALAIGIFGSYAGIRMVTTSVNAQDYQWVRSAHLSTNLLGLVGIIIATTLPYMMATQARMKMSKRATPLAVRSMFAAMTIATLVAGLGMLFQQPAVAGVGYIGYVIALGYSMSLLPILGEKQIRWAGWRIAHLAAGVLWWAGCVVAMAVNAFRDRPIPETVLLVLIIGGFAQILIGSLAYFAPVLRGGGQKGLSNGFRTTRSLLGFIAANVAVVGLAIRSGWLIALGLGVWYFDGVARIAILALGDPNKDDKKEDKSTGNAATSNKPSGSKSSGDNDTVGKPVETAASAD